MSFQDMVDNGTIQLLDGKYYYGGNEILGIFEGNENIYKNERTKTDDDTELFFKSLGLPLDGYDITGKTIYIIVDGKVVDYDGSLLKEYNDVLIGTNSVDIPSTLDDIYAYIIKGRSARTAGTSPDNPTEINGTGEKESETSYKIALKKGDILHHFITIESPMYGDSNIADFICTENDYQQFVTADDNAVSTQQDEILYVGV